MWSISSAFFTNWVREAVLGISQASRSVATRISAWRPWRVSDEIWMSDHGNVSFEMKDVKVDDMYESQENSGLSTRWRKWKKLSDNRLGWVQSVRLIIAQNACGNALADDARTTVDSAERWKAIWRFGSLWMLLHCRSRLEEYTASLTDCKASLKRKALRRLKEQKTTLVGSEGQLLEMLLCK